MNMYDETIILNEKERKLVEYFETYTTEEIIQEVQQYLPSLHSHPDTIHTLNKMNLPQPVQNTLIFYVFFANQQTLTSHQLFVLADLFRKLDINNAHDAFIFFKQYYLFDKS